MGIACQYQEKSLDFTVQESLQQGETHQRNQQPEQSIDGAEILHEVKFSLFLGLFYSRFDNGGKIIHLQACSTYKCTVNFFLGKELSRVGTRHRPAV